MGRRASQFIHEGNYAAEVTVDLSEDGGEWSPTIGVEDIRRLDRVRRALREGDLGEAGKDARVFTLVPYGSDSERAVAGFAENTQDELKP